MKHFHYPVTAEQLRELCHPDPGHAFAEPFRWGDDWGVANGWLGLRVRTFLDCEWVSAEAVERIERLPWGRFEKVQDDWGKLDDRRGGLWRHGESRVWQRLQDGRAVPWTLQRVNVGPGCVQVTRGMLQLVSKLPRAEVNLGPMGQEWLMVRFNGGEGFLKGFEGKERRSTGLWLWQGQDDLGI